jgi:hypothetical protein
MRAGGAGTGSSFARSATSSAVRPGLSRIRRYATCGSLHSAISSPSHPAWVPSRIRIILVTADAPSLASAGPPPPLPPGSRHYAHLARPG